MDPARTTYATQREDARRLLESRASYLLRTRAGVALVYLAITVLFLAFHLIRPEMIPAMYLALLELLINVPYLWVSRRYPGDPLLVYYAPQTVDLIVITAGIHYAGGIASQHSVLFYVPLIVFAASVQSVLACFYLATASATCFATLLWLEGSGHLASVPGILQVVATPAASWNVAVGTFLLLEAIAMVASVLAHLLRRESTDLARARGELALVNQALAQRVAELGHANAALTDHNRRLERLRRQIELYARSVSHDLKTPLSAARGALALLQERLRAPDSESSSYVELTERNLRTANEMLDALQDVTLTVHRREEFATVDVGTLLADLEIEFAPAVQRAGIRLHILTPLPLVRAQREKLREVFRNLLANAVKYVGGTSGGEIRVGSFERTGGSGFYVRDNGVGIPTDLQETIFEPFQRVPEHLTIPTRGMGLGLALVKQIVEQHGGEVWVESEPGHGAIFCFTLGEAREAGERPDLHS
jgi:signal transduction histidine kinase